MGRLVLFLSFALTLVGCTKSLSRTDIEAPLIGDIAMPAVKIESVGVAFEVPVDYELVSPASWSSDIPTRELQSIPFDDIKFCGTFGYRNRIRLMAETTHISADYNSYWDRANGRDAKTVYYHFKLSVAPRTTFVRPSGLWPGSIIQ